MMPVQDEWQQFASDFFWEAVISSCVVPLAVGLLLVALLLYAYLPLRIRTLRSDECRCQECGYLLRGLTSERCPECGVPYDTSSVIAANRESSSDKDVPSDRCSEVRRGFGGRNEKRMSRKVR